MARLRVSTELASKLASQLERILATFRDLASVETEGVEPSPYAIEIENVTRTDGPVAGPIQRLPDGPSLVDGDFYRVPKAVE